MASDTPIRTYTDPEAGWAWLPREMSPEMIRAAEEAFKPHDTVILNVSRMWEALWDTAPRYRPPDPLR